MGKAVAVPDSSEHIAETESRRSSARRSRTESLKTFNEILGNFGPYQICICFFILLSGVFCTWQTVGFIFSSRITDYKCAIANFTPCDPECPEVVFPRLNDVDNIVVEWNLICSEGDKDEMAQSILILGYMTGCIIFGHMADQVGRRPCFLSACMTSLIMGFIVGVSPWFWLFCFVRFFLGLACGGLTICSLVFLVEYVSMEKRELMVIMFRLPYTLGYSTLAAIAFFIPKWRHLQLATTGFGLVFIVYFWVIPESPRWLLVMGYIDRCVKVLQATSKNHNLPLEHLRAIVKKAHLQLRADYLLKTGTMVDLFRTPNMCKKTCILSFAWFSLYFKLYGTVDYLAFISDNMYLGFGFGGSLTVMGTLIAYPIVKFVTRRRALLVLFGFSAICLFLTSATPNTDANFFTTALTMIVITLTSIAHVNMQLFSTELFPTFLRNSGMGFIICIGRLGSVVSPYVLQSHSIKFWLPAIFYGVTSSISAIVILLLPETKNAKLPDTIQEGENFGKHDTHLEPARESSESNNG